MVILMIVVRRITFLITHNTGRLEPTDTLRGAGSVDGPLSMEKLAAGVLRHYERRPGTILETCDVNPGPMVTARQIAKKDAALVLVMDPDPSPPGTKLPPLDVHQPCGSIHPGFCRTKHAHLSYVVVPVCEPQQIL